MPHSNADGTTGSGPAHHSSLFPLTLGALGVVFGDIGTSPLYALRECFDPDHGLVLTPPNVLGVVSLVLWALVLIVSMKYLLFVMRADNRGEGGVLALMALALQAGSSARERNLKVFLGLCGAALLYGDGIITPSISVLSAVEGLELATPWFGPYVQTVTVAILVTLFCIQRGGTAKLGALFGPIIVLWYVTLGALGLPRIVEDPSVLAAVNPVYAARFFLLHGTHAFLTLGAVFLAVTGVEALYADMGHFGRTPIRLGWFCVAFPGLALNYLGQAAVLLSDTTAAENPFFRLAPEWAVIPLVLLATVATVIASQALISGAYSLTSQAVQLGYLPRLRIRHTSRKEYGQIYIPVVNWLLCAGTVVLVILFPSSGSLASAYGIAVSTTMVITSVLLYFVARDIWKWPPLRLYPFMGILLLVDLAFFGANFSKVLDGGWIPLALAALVFTLMSTWWTGRELLWKKLIAQMQPFDEFFVGLDTLSYTRVPGTAVFLVRDLNVTPPALLYNLRHNHVLHERVILLTVVTEPVPYVGTRGKRLETRDLGRGFTRWVIHHGFMENVNVPREVEQWSTTALGISVDDVTFFLDRVIPVPTNHPGMALWREGLFAFMSQNAMRATKFYRIPARQVIEIGFQVEI